MTAGELLTIIAAVGALVTVVGGVIVNVIVALRSEVKDTKEKVVEALAETKVISGHVNSAASTAAAKSDAMEKELGRLNALISKQDQTAALLAQASIVVPATPTAVAPDRLHEIEEQTKVNGG